MLTTLVVLARILANPVSNVFQKRLAERSATPAFIIATAHGLLLLPCVAAWPFVPVGPLGASFWGNAVVAVLLAVASNVLLVHALKLADLSVLGPINAYKAVISLVLGVFLVGEVPSAPGLVGVLLVLAGSYAVVEPDAAAPRHGAVGRVLRDRGIQYRLLALLFSATEALFLKRALLLSSPATTFLVWCILGFPVAAALATIQLRGVSARDRSMLRSEWRTYLALAATTGIMQLATLVTFGVLQVGYSLALFQLSSVVSVLLGYRYFEERSIRRRLIGSVVMMVGAGLIVALGTPR